jgi:hypothetical protein
MVDTKFLNGFGSVLEVQAGVDFLFFVSSSVLLLGSGLLLRRSGGDLGSLGSILLSLLLSLLELAMCPIIDEQCQVWVFGGACIVKDRLR